jgi:outer membrane receptor protein involved in Fe transport
LVLDPQGATVAGANVTATHEGTGVSTATVTSSVGVYLFPSLLAGSYTLRIEAPGFSVYLGSAIPVFAAQTTEVTAALVLGSTTTVIRVESAADVVQTETSQLGGAFEGRSITEIPVAAGPNPSVLNLSVFLPNTTSAAGGVAGTGGSLGGLRGRQNSFSIDGVDNNDPALTVASQQVIPDAVQQFTVNQNIFTAEYGRGSGGQFNVITKTGSNALHFDAWFYNMNRAYNAADNLEHDDIAKGVRPGKRRFDFNRAGGGVGGPVLRDRLFLYGAYEFNNFGKEDTGRGLVPTSSGLATLLSLAVNPQVRALLSEFPAAPAQNSCPGPPACTVTVSGQPIPVGTINAAAPNLVRQHSYIINADLNASQHSGHVRYLASRDRRMLFGDFPQAQFASPVATDNHRVIMSHVWTATPRLVNEFRGSFARFSQFSPLSGVAASYPALFIFDMNSLFLGPTSAILPQHRLFNEYLLGDTVTWTMGRHSLKAGGQYIWFTAPSSISLSFPRGQYRYLSLNEMVNDRAPGIDASFGVGSGYFAGNSHAFGLFLQDDIKVRPHLTLHLGLRYDFFGNPADTKLNALNAIANLRGTPLVFNVPTRDWNNIGPRVGFAWDPTGSGRWSVRGGAGIAYDWIPWNFYSNGLPIQLQAILSIPSACSGMLGLLPAWCPSKTGFLANGGMKIDFVPPSTAAAAREQTTQMMADARSPKVFSWSLGVQRQILRNTSIEVRYLATRALELPVQIQLNSITAFENGAKPLPTYFLQTDIPSTVPATAPTLAQFKALIGKGPLRRYGSQGFTEGAVTLALPVGASAYHGGAVELLHRFDRGLLLRANYTYSKTLDDSTVELNTSSVNPRRPQDSFNLRDEWARSALDMRHKVSISFLYDTPRVASVHAVARSLLNGWALSGTYLFQSGQPVTIQSGVGVDSNGNNDVETDRAILNPNGTERRGSLVTPVCRNPSTGATFTGAGCADPFGRPLDAGIVVGYLATTPNAKYIQAGAGALSNLGRNTFTSPYFNVWNLAILKNDQVTERVRLQLRLEAFNAFNHPNFTIGTTSVFQSDKNARTGYASLNSRDFLNSRIFNGGSRQLQLGLKISY